jgi:putative hydrolase of the HAD superfamily
MRGERAVIFDLDDTLYREHDALEREWQANGRGRVFDAVIERFGLDVPVAELVDVYRSHDPELSLYPDAERALSRLEAAGTPIGVLTDGLASVQRRKLQALALDRRVPCIVVSDDYGLDAYKPSPVPYRAALEQLGLSASEAVYVGDNPHKDFIGARTLGMGTVRVRRRTGDHAETVLDSEHEADRTISSLDELEE